MKADKERSMNLYLKYQNHMKSIAQHLKAAQEIHNEITKDSTDLRIDFHKNTKPLYKLIVLMNQNVNAQ